MGGGLLLRQVVLTPSAFVAYACWRCAVWEGSREAAGKGSSLFRLEAEAARTLQAEGRQASLCDLPTQPMKKMFFRRIKQSNLVH